MITQWIQTPVGRLQAVWSDSGKLQSCGFTRESQATLLPSEIQPQQRLLEERLELYFNHGTFDWDLESLDWTDITPFHERVLRECYAIPAGETLTYAELACRSGSPRAARAVGSAMARNRWPLLIPCHRVLGASGQLTGYSGTGGLKTKRWLLLLETHTMKPALS